MEPGERFNSYSHLVALLGSLAGTAFLVESARRSGGALAVSGVAAFGGCAVLLYAASLLFHSSRGRAKVLWARADHAAIHLMIAGSYTPFALAGQPPAQGHVIGWGLTMLALIWLAALTGALRELTATRRPSLALYLLLGWLCVAGGMALAPTLGPVVTGWLLAGAACYTGGTVFYVNRRGWPHAHGVWHLFVMGGTACHGVAVALVQHAPG
jgi:hemolysin III